MEDPPEDENEPVNGWSSNLGPFSLLIPGIQHVLERALDGCKELPKPRGTLCRGMQAWGPGQAGRTASITFAFP